jgi:leader peptidase (prepilin peptidase) / N-methyltransferase
VTSLFAFWAFLLGLVVGSFLNVCIHRLPRGLSIVTPRSHCPQCGRFLRWYDNIPLVSYMLLRGRCRTCRKAIPFRYTLVEAVTAVLSVLVYAKFGVSWAYVLYFFLLTAPLICIAFIDLEHKIIPDMISLPGIAAGVATTLVISGPPYSAALITSFGGILAGGGTLFAISWVYEKIRHQEGIGGGDVKLAAMIGAFFGWKAVFLILLLSSLLGSIAGIFLMICLRRGSQASIPFGPFLSAGALVYLFVGNELVRWYLGLSSRLY